MPPRWSQGSGRQRRNRMEPKSLLLAALALIAALTGSRAASVCEVVLEADPADGITLLPEGKRIFCTGDPVAFTTGSNFIPDNNDNSTWQLTGPFGSASVQFDDVLMFPAAYTVLTGASDVVFTNITIRNVDYGGDQAIFGLSSCTNCTIQNLYLEGMRAQVQSTNVFLIDALSTVTIENAVVTGLGQVPANGGVGSPCSALHVRDSEVVLQNAVFTNLAVNVFATVMVSADPFTAGSSSKLTVRNTTWRDLTLSTVDPGLISTYQPGRIAALVGGGAVLELGDGVIVANVQLAGADQSTGKPADSLFSFDTAGATVTISPSVQLDAAAVNAGAVFTVPVASGETIDSSSAWFPYMMYGATFTANDITLSLSDVALQAGLQLHGTGATLNLRNVTMGQLTLDTPGLTPLSLRNLTLSGLELPSFNNAVVDISDVTITSQQQQRRPLITAENDSRITLTDVTISRVSVAPDNIQVDRYSAVLLHADTGTVATVTRLTVSGVDWAPPNDNGYFSETQLFRSGNGSSLAVLDSSISGIRSCGTVFSAVDGGALRLVRVNISDVDSSGAVEKRAVVRVEGGGSSLVAIDTALRRINASDSTNGIALSVLQPGAVTLSGFMLDGVYGPKSSAIQLLLKNSTAPITLSGLNIHSATSASALKVSEPGSQITVQHSLFEDCVSSAGGTFALTGCNSDNSTMQLQLLNVTFNRNTGGNEGGGVQTVMCHVLVRDSVFTRNAAANQGAAISLRQGSLTLENTSFVSNSLSSTTGGTNGGAVYAEQCAVSITASTFTRNSALGAGGRGGGLFMTGSRASITRSTFFANSASGQGGAMMAYQTWLTMNDSVVAGNIAPLGGGVAMYDAVPKVTLLQLTAPASPLLAASPPPPPSLPPLPPSPPPAPAGNLTSGYVAQTTLSDSFFGEFVNTTFTQNSCSDGLNMGGGGLYVREQVERWNVLVYKCTFVSNSCPRGGGMLSGYLQRTYIVRSEFRLNRATIEGGAVTMTPSNDRGSYLLIQENQFVNNTAKILGGAVQAGSAMVEVAYNNFTGNGDGTVSLYGGAFYAEACQLVPGMPPTTANLDFRFNTWDSNQALGGGAISFRLCNVTMYRELFVNNYAHAGGGAVEAINTLQTPLTTTQLNEVTMRNNTARQNGGAMSVLGTGVMLLHSIFEANNASIAGGGIAALDASPSALLVLKRKTVPFYTPDEEYFLRVYMDNSTFNSNVADQGGGALYTDSCGLVVQNSRFDGNIAGDGFPNDDWSDSGGALTAITAWSNMYIGSSNFTNNQAFGGPAGAILLVGTTAIIDACNFHNSIASTSGGAIAAADRLRNDSNAYNVPNLVVRTSTFTNNIARRQNGGALLATGMNATTFTSTFKRNVAGGNGGAVAFLNNLDAGFMANWFEANSADQYGGATYVVNTPIVSVLTTTFLNNRANRTGGALSMISCNCTLTAQSTFEGNWVGGRGGAVHLQPVDNDDGNTNTLAESADCVGHFLSTIRRMLTPEGLALLGTVDTRVETYNATIVYDGASLQVMTIGQFGRGGLRLPTPVLSGPGQITGFDTQVNLAAGSSVKLASGSAFAFADWDRFTVQMDGSSTRLVYLDGAITTPLSPGEVVVLAPGSALTALSDSMSLLPTNTSMALTNGGTVWKLLNGTLLSADNTTAALSVVPGARTRIGLLDGSITVSDWNRYVLWTYGSGSYLYDVVTGSARALPYADVSVANGSPLMRHSAADAELTAPLGITTSADPASGGEAWGLSNGTTLSINGATQIAVSALLANGSTMQIRRGSSLAPRKWAGYTVTLSSDSPATLLSLPSIVSSAEVSSALLMGSVVSLPEGSAVSRLTSSMAMLPAGTLINPDGGSWVLNNGSALAATGGNVAALLVLPAGTTVALSDADVFTVGPSEWNRYSLWTGTMGTLLHNTSSGEVFVLSDSAAVSLTRAAPLTWHSDKAVVGRQATFTVSGNTWTLGGSLSGSYTRGGSVVGCSSVLSRDSRIAMPNGTTLASSEWYRYLVWMAADGTYLFDSLTLSNAKLPDGTLVTLTGNSVIFPHDSGTTMVAAGGQTLTVQPGAWQQSGGGSLSPSGDVTSVVVVPAEGSSISVGGPAGASGALPLVPRVGSSIVWLSRNGSQLVDSALSVTYRLVTGSSVQLAAGSLLLNHGSSTSIMSDAVNVTLQQAGGSQAWSFTDGRTLSVGSGVTVLALAPAPLSSVVFNNPTTIPIAVSAKNGVWAGRYSTLLYSLEVEGSYTLAEGSEVTVGANTSLSMYINKRITIAYWDAPDTFIVRGREWVLTNGTRISVGDGWNDVDDSQVITHVPSITEMPDEISRSCSADFTNGVYQKDAYAYDYYALRALLNPWLQPDFETNVAPQVAAAATGLSLADTAGFNATMLIPGYTLPTFDNAGRPIGAIVTCTATSAPPATSRSRGLSTLLVDVVACGNVADMKGGVMVVDGGHGRVLLDRLVFYNNSVTRGDGGALALYQDDDQLNMQLEVFITSSNFSNNAAMSGTGGALSLIADNMHQQVSVTNTTIDGNQAAMGGGISLSHNISAVFNSSVISNNVGNASAMQQGASANVANDRNVGSGGGIMAYRCNELLLTHGTRVENNTASARGGGVGVVSCALATVNSTLLQGNRAQSAGAVYLYNSLPVSGTYKPEDPVGAMIAVVAKSNFTDNVAVPAPDAVMLTEGFGGGIYLRSHVSTLLADSYFKGNNASLQGGSIFIESTCDLNDQSWFLERNRSAVTAFTSSSVSFANTVQALQVVRPKGCWGTVVYLPQFYNNEALLSGGALFSSHPEALSLSCNDANATHASSNLPIDYADFSEPYLAGRVAETMKMASFQVLDNKVVATCYRQELESLDVNATDLTGNTLSTLVVNDNRAKGYGYLIAIVPSKLRIINVNWTGNTSNMAGMDSSSSAISNVWPGATGSLDGLYGTVSTDAGVMALDGGSGSAGGNSITAGTLAEAPFFRSWPDSVFDNDTQTDRRTVSYHITTLSNKPLDLSILLLDALDQVASENTTLRQAQVRARYLNSSNGCFAELLGGIEGVARNGTAVMSAMRLRALKGDNYTIQFKVEDSIFSGTVEPLTINISVPACSIGEVPRDNGFLCQKCDPRSFSLWQDTEPLVNCTYPAISDITCQPCPDGAECPGGAVVVPMQGYWQSAANSTFMNACPNPEACRDGDDDMQNMLVTCQEWWYSRPADFNYTAYINLVLNLTDAASNTFGGFSALTLSGEAFNASNLDDLCVLWGLPYNHPASYARKQCATGYSGNLCAVCISVDGRHYTGPGDFSCNECFDRTISVLVAVAGFVANVVTVLVTVILTFMADYTEDEDMAIGDLVKVLIVHIQFFCIVTRLNINWPTSVSGFTGLLSALTGAVTEVYSPSCLLDESATPAEMARIDQLAAIITPLVVVIVVAALWLVRFGLFNFRQIAGGQTGQEHIKDMRTIEEYKQDRASRVAQRRLAEHLGEEAMGTFGEEEFNNAMEDGSQQGEDGLDLQAGDMDGQRPSHMVREMRRRMMAEHQAEPAAAAAGEDNKEEKEEEEQQEQEGGQQKPLAGVSSRESSPDSAVVEAATVGLLMDNESDEDSKGVMMPPPPAAPLPPPMAPPPVGPPTQDQSPANSEADAQPNTPGAADAISAAAAASVAMSDPALPQAAAPGLPPLPPRGSGTSPTPASGATAAPGEAAPTGGVGIPTRRPSVGGLKTRVSIKTGRSRVSFDDQALSGGTPSSETGTPSHRTIVLANASTDRGGLVPPPPASTQRTSFRAAAAAGLSLGAIHNAAYNSDSGFSTPTGRDRRPPSLPTIPSLGRAKVAVAAAVAKAAYDADSASASIEGADVTAEGGDIETGNGRHGASCRASPLAPKSVAGPSRLNAHARNHGSGGSGRAVPAPDSSGSGDPLVHGSESQRGSFGPKAPGSFGGKAAGSFGSKPPALTERRTSSMLAMKQRLTASTVWVRNFFKYDEEAVEEGEIRWASLANIDRTMTWWRQVLLVVMIACFILYPAWAQATLMIFACYYLDDGSGAYPEYQLAQWGKGYWLLNMNQECYAGEHAALWIPIGVVCIIVICLGIPLLTFMVTFMHRTTLDTVHVVQTYGFLYRRYNYDRYFWWEAVMQLQTLLLVIVDVFGRVLVVYQQAVLLMIVLMLIMWSNMFYQPLKHEILDQMSSMSLAVLSFTVALGLFFVPPTDRKDPVTPVAGAAIGGLILAMNIALVVYFVYVMLTHGREAITRGVTRAREHMLVATSKMHMGLTVVRDRVSNGAHKLRALTSRSLTSVQSKMRHVSDRRRSGSNSGLVPTPPTSNVTPDT